MLRFGGLTFRRRGSDFSGRWLLEGQGYHGGLKLPHVPQRYAKPLEVSVSEVRQSLQFDVVVSERLCVLADAKFFEPLRDVAC